MCLLVPLQKPTYIMGRYRIHLIGGEVDLLLRLDRLTDCVVREPMMIRPTRPLLICFWIVDQGNYHLLHLAAVNMAGEAAREPAPRLFRTPAMPRSTRHSRSDGQCYRTCNLDEYSRSRRTSATGRGPGTWFSGEAHRHCEWTD